MLHATAHDQPPPEQFLAELARALSRAGVGLTPVAIGDMVQDIAKSHAPDDGENETFWLALADRLGESQEELFKRLAPYVTNQMGPLPAPLRAAVAFARQTTPPPETSIERTASISTLIHTGLSGLILTHPYLPTYMERLECLDENRLPPENADRAVHLLALLATGRADLPEHELALPKLLAGLPVNMPVSRGFAASDEEKALATDLLSHLASQVPALVNTTPEALRETFLMRHGQIAPARDGSNLTLRVTKGPFDMLLDQVPWQISLIRLPWMQEALHVEWT